MDKHTALQVFDGVMIGDGGLSRALLAGDPVELCHKVNCSRFTLNQSTERGDHMDWLLYVKVALALLDIEVSPGYPKYCTVRSRGKTFGSSKLLTLTSSWLTEQRKVWYPKGYKEVPGWFNFTPVSLANMVMCDMNSNRDKRSPCTVNIHLETQGFGLESIIIIENSLRRMEFHTGRGIENLGASGIRVTILQDSVDAFMNTIRPWVLPSFEYKVKYK